MDVLIICLKESGYGCQLLSVYFSCLLYTDDIMLLSHSLCAMHYMLKICDDFAAEYDTKFNTDKPIAIQIGNHCDEMCEPLVLSSNNLQLVL